ncbi:MAG: peptidyl-prolyl cis-trans isomerase [Polyangiales bacterium]
MGRFTRVVVAVTLASALSAGLAGAQSGEDPVVARVGDRPIKTSFVKAALAGVPRFELEALGTTKLDILRRYVDEAVVREELLAEAARRKGALEDRAAMLQLNKSLAGALVRRELGKIGTRATIPAEEVKAYYDAHVAEYRTPERVRIAHIVVATKADADAVLAKALGDKTREGWAKLVADTSLDMSTKRTGGDLGFVSADGRSSEPKVVVPMKLVTAAFALADGEMVKEPVQSEAGWHIVWRRGHVPPLVRSLDQEEQTISELMFEQKQQDAYKGLLERLRGGGGVEIDEELLPIPTLDVGPRPLPKQPSK